MSKEEFYYRLNDMKLDIIMLSIEMLFVGAVIGLCAGYLLDKLKNNSK